MATSEKLKVLFATSEVAPLIKTGGLADVSAALPVALSALGVDMRVLLPGYPQVMEALKTKSRVAALPGLPGVPAASLVASKLPSGLPLLVVECPIYDRPGGPYQDGSGMDWPDNDMRFGLFSYVGAVLSAPGSPFPAWQPHVVHCNDWQTALTPVYLNYVHGPRARTLMTVHNLAFQGIFPQQSANRLGLPPQAFTIDGVEFYGSLSFLKGGLQFADRITTVSPSYAREIQTEPLGMGLQGLLSHRADVLTGILNGIDIDTWDPESDPYIERYYNASRLAAKQDNKRALQLRMGLQDAPLTPLFGSVSRMTGQKGLDVLADIAAKLVQLPAQLAVLGSGDPALQSRFQRLAADHPGQVAVQIGFDESLSHQIEAGADIFAMPSRFEPCGLNQMYSQRYGTPPLVHGTGGLLDSVVDCTPATLKDRTATGFVFAPLDASTMLRNCSRAAGVYGEQRSWRQLQKNGMQRDFSWEARARQYLDLYRMLPVG